MYGPAAESQPLDGAGNIRVRSLFKTAGLLGVVALSVSAVVAIVAPFVLPAWAYDALYGWRYPRAWSCADARILDRGPVVASGRYEVQLGQLPLQPQDRRYHLCDLPGVLLHPGLFVAMSDPYSPEGWSREKRLAQGVDFSIAIFSATGEDLGAASGALADDWVWSGPHEGRVFVYSRELSLSASSRRSYDLEVTVDAQSAPGLEPPRLLLLGGGWK